MNTLRNKDLYKIFLVIIKYIPIILAITKIITLVLNYFKIKTFILTCFGGTSIVLLVLLYLISIIFRFCGIYRLALNYTSLITIITVLDYYLRFPISKLLLYEIYGIITGVFIVIWIYVWYKNRNNPKIDHIKQLCDNCC